MKKSTIVAFCVLAISLVSIVAYAAEGWTSWSTVDEVWGGYSDGDIYVRGLSNTAGCSSSDIKFESSYADTASIQSLATAALLSGKDFKCYVSGCSGSYQKGYRCKLGN